MRFKIHLLTTVSALAILGAGASSRPASAADLGARPAPVYKAPAPVVEAPFSWRGFYVGVQGGFGWLDHKQTTDVSNQACDENNGISHCSFDATGGVFGGFAGYNWQAGNIIFGVEADGSWAGLKKSETFDTGFLGDVTVRGKVDWLATVRGRLGMAFSPTMIYVTGGVAFAGVKSSWINDFNTPIGVSDDKTKTGWVAGGGIEHAFNNMWSVRVEALYHDLGKDSGSTFSSSTYATEFRHRVTTVRGGLALRW